MHHALGLRAAYLPATDWHHVSALTICGLASGALTAGAVFERIWLRLVTLLGAELRPFAASRCLPVRRSVAPHVFERHWWGTWNLLARPLANDGLPDWTAPGRRQFTGPVKSVEAYCRCPADECWFRC